MLCPSNKFALQLNKYVAERVLPRQNNMYKTIREISKVVSEVLREVEAQEPRFISSLNEINGRYEGLTVVSQKEFEVSKIHDRQRTILVEHV
jgi:putative nucleotidyltransferase